MREFYQGEGSQRYDGNAGTPAYLAALANPLSEFDAAYAEFLRKAAEHSQNRQPRFAHNHLAQSNMLAQYQRLNAGASGQALLPGANNALAHTSGMDSKTIAAALLKKKFMEDLQAIQIGSHPMLTVGIDGMMGTSPVEGTTPALMTGVVPSYVEKMLTQSNPNAMDEYTDEMKCRLAGGRICNGSYITGHLHYRHSPGQRACRSCRTRASTFVDAARTRVMSTTLSRKGVKIFASKSTRIRAYVLGHVKPNKPLIAVFATVKEAEVAEAEQHGLTKNDENLTVKYSCHVHRFEIESVCPVFSANINEIGDAGSIRYDSSPSSTSAGSENDLSPSTSEATEDLLLEKNYSASDIIMQAANASVQAALKAQSASRASSPGQGRNTSPTRGTSVGQPPQMPFTATSLASIVKQQQVVNQGKHGVLSPTMDASNSPLMLGKDAATVSQLMSAAGSNSEILALLNQVTNPRTEARTDPTTSVSVPVGRSQSTTSPLLDHQGSTGNGLSPGSHPISPPNRHEWSPSFNPAYQLMDAKSGTATATSTGTIEDVLASMPKSMLTVHVTPSVWEPSAGLPSVTGVLADLPVLMQCPTVKWHFSGSSRPINGRVLRHVPPFTAEIEVPLPPVEPLTHALTSGSPGLMATIEIILEELSLSWSLNFLYRVQSSADAIQVQQNYDDLSGGGGFGNNRKRRFYDDDSDGSGGGDSDGTGGSKRARTFGGGHHSDFSGYQCHFNVHQNCSWLESISNACIRAEVTAVMCHGFGVSFNVMHTTTYFLNAPADLQFLIDSVAHFLAPKDMPLAPLFRHHYHELTWFGGVLSAGDFGIFDDEEEIYMYEFTDTSTPESTSVEISENVRAVAFAKEERPTPTRVAEGLVDIEHSMYSSNSGGSSNSAEQVTVDISRGVQATTIQRGSGMSTHTSSGSSVDASGSSKLKSPTLLTNLWTSTSVTCVAATLAVTIALLLSASVADGQMADWMFGIAPALAGILITCVLCSAYERFSQPLLGRSQRFWTLTLLSYPLAVGMFVEAVSKVDETIRRGINTGEQVWGMVLPLAVLPTLLQNFEFRRETFTKWVTLPCCLLMIGECLFDGVFEYIPFFMLPLIIGAMFLGQMNPSTDARVSLFGALFMSLSKALGLTNMFIASEMHAVPGMLTLQGISLILYTMVVQFAPLSFEGVFLVHRHIFLRLPHENF